MTVEEVSLSPDDRSGLSYKSPTAGRSFLCFEYRHRLGDEFIDVLKTLNKLGLDSTKPVSVRGQQVSPRDVVAACLPDPATLGDKIGRGKYASDLHKRSISAGQRSDP